MLGDVDGVPLPLGLVLGDCVSVRVIEGDSEGVPLRLGDAEGVAEELGEIDVDCVPVPECEGEEDLTCDSVPLGLGVVVNDTV